MNLLLSMLVKKNKIGEHSGKLQASRWIVQITGSLPIVLLQI